jgi:multiple sugar transport system substrate-binding protein
MNDYKWRGGHVSRLSAVCVIAAGAAVTLLLSACDKKPETASPPKGVLRVAIANETTFQQNYGDYFAAKFPELEVQIIPTQGMYDEGKDAIKEYIKLIDENRPDLLFTNSFDYEKLAANGKLYNLSPLIEKDRFDIDNLLPAAVDYLRIKGQGIIYGLSPKFSSSVLYYNKELFDRYHLPYPTDRMTWEDLFRLAARFPAEGGKEERIYGFHMGYMQSPMQLANYIGRAEGLSMVNAEGTQLMIDTDAWRRIYRLVVDGYKSGVLQWTYTPDKKIYHKEDVEAEDLFGAGRAAMTINNTNQIHSLKQRGATFAWSMAGVPSADPTHTKNPDFYLYPIFSIAAQADNVSNAWEVLKYFNGAEAARIEAKTSTDLPVRKAFAKEVDGHSLEPFYQVKYEETTEDGYNEKIPREFSESYNALADTLVNAMLNGEMSLEEGLRQMQEQGQPVLDKAHLAKQE